MENALQEQAAPQVGKAPMQENPVTRNRLVARLAIGTILVLLATAAAMFAWAVLGDSQAPRQQEGGTLEAAPPAREDAGLLGTAIVKTPDLTALLGMTPDDAQAAIGQGATLRNGVPTGMEVPGADELVVALAEVRSKDGPGTPTVFLQMDGSGRVVQARYSAALRFYGFTNGVTFRTALDEAHVVEATLADAGVEVPAGVAACPPDAASYSTYGDDGRTLVRENAAFSGEGRQRGLPVRWSAWLDYDYTRANETGNLVYTRRVLCVGVRS